MNHTGVAKTEMSELAERRGGWTAPGKGIERKLLRRCDGSRQFNLANQVQFFEGVKNRVEGHPALSRHTNCTIFVGRKWDVPAGSIVSMFKNLCLTGPHRKVGVPMRGQPNSHSEELKCDKRNKEYGTFIAAHNSLGWKASSGL